jgi:hypothetical protein
MFGVSSPSNAGIEGMLQSKIVAKGRMNAISCTCNFGRDDGRRRCPRRSYNYLSSSGTRWLTPQSNS